MKRIVLRNVRTGEAVGSVPAPGPVGSKMESDYKSPGRREMAKSLKGKRHQKKLWHMRGANIPQAVEEDKTFFQLFQMSKDLEQVLAELKSETIPDLAAIHAARDAFNASINAVRARWLELVPEDRPC